MTGHGNQGERGAAPAAAEDPGVPREVAGGGRGARAGNAAGKMRGDGRPTGEGLAARVPGLVVALAGAGLLTWSLWSGSRPVEGLQRAGAEWLVPESGVELESAAQQPAGGRGEEDAVGAEGGAAGVLRGSPGALGQSEADPAAIGELLIDVNVATAAQFELLPDIGPVMAQRIVDNRAAHGPFATPDDLMRVPGIGPKTLEKIRGLVVCGGG